MMMNGDIFEKRIRYRFKLIFFSIIFLFTPLQILFFFLLFVSFSLLLLFHYLGFLIDIAILLIIMVNLRKRVFSVEIGVSNNRDKIINEINKYYQKVKPCFVISIISLIILFILIVIVFNYSTIIILFNLLIILMFLIIFLNLPLYAFGKLLNSALSEKANN
jgi:hypothetical protein